MKDLEKELEEKLKKVQTLFPKLAMFDVNRNYFNRIINREIRLPKEGDWSWEIIFNAEELSQSSTPIPAVLRTVLDAQEKNNKKFSINIGYLSKLATRRNNELAFVSLKTIQLNNSIFIVPVKTERWFGDGLKKEKLSVGEDEFYLGVPNTASLMLTNKLTDCRKSLFIDCLGNSLPDGKSPFFFLNNSGDIEFSLNRKDIGNRKAVYTRFIGKII